MAVMSYDIIVRQLAIRSDVLIENFKPGSTPTIPYSSPSTHNATSTALEKWDLHPAAIHPYNPDLIYTRVSGYGQTGPWEPRPGYASVCEAESGFRYINGFPDEASGALNGPPVRPNISLGDSVAGLHAAFGTVLALLQRQRKKEAGEAGGTTVDVSILESMLNLMEGIIPEYDRKSKIRGPSGSSVTGIVPTNAYPCLPASSSSTTPVYIVIGANGDTLYARLMHLIGAPHLASPQYAQNHQRAVPAAQSAIEEAIRAWTSVRSTTDVEQALEAAKIPVGRVVNVKDMVEQGEQLRARGAIQDVWVPSKGEDGWSVKMQGTFPVLEGCEAKPRWAGPDLGAHTGDVLGGLLGLSEAELQRLKEKDIIG
ncbi:L-carnitine dehydratase bile acid-inducible protein f [Mycena indigotica]|uniref:L-carnitine dehydratase bile acid-inducible protein f n=1 Tax=Mycena indigotica TaxID=2126181 RepID=A0A8H6SRR0_9AGAR|nr:L-carnitine dehydratase bile acid-inducible protein f [Mycena indigotica]KAF7303506.1 L-carnitine dehydratase bile acid-inducible protein f [Mycena indigotica]